MELPIQKLNGWEIARIGVSFGGLILLGFVISLYAKKDAQQLKRDDNFATALQASATAIQSNTEVIRQINKDQINQTEVVRQLKDSVQTMTNLIFSQKR